MQDKNNLLDSDNILSAILVELKKKVTSKQWYGFMSTNVQKRIDWIFDNFRFVGIQFASSFMTMFKWEAYKRFLDKESILLQPDTGKFQKMIQINRISEELYLCGLNPTKFLLGLEDWEKPNDADVEGCLFLCQEILENKSMLEAICTNANQLNKEDVDRMELISSIPFKQKTI